MSGGGPREVVKVRLRAHVYTSPVMPREEARHLRDDLRDLIIAAREGVEFVEFTDRHGREVSVRARDVSIIEVGVPADDDEDRSHAGRRRPGSTTFASPGPPKPGPTPPLGVVQGGAMAVPSPSDLARDRHPAGSRT